MSSKAYRIPSAIDRLRKQQMQIKDLQALQRNRNTPRPVASTAFAGTSAAGSQGGTGNFLATKGDTMIGPLALAPPVDFSVDIDVDGILDIGESSSNSQYSSNIQIEDVPTSTTLDTIAGAAFDGQILVIRTFAPSPITIAQATLANGGNIQTPNDADFIIGDLQMISLVFDAALLVFANTGGTWRVLTGDTTGGGGGNVPDGTAQFQHLEWNGAAWIAQQALAFGAMSADAGQLKMPNDTIGLAWRTGANDGNAELKFTTQDEFDFTVSNNADVVLLLRAQNAVDADNLFLVEQQSGSAGQAILTAPNNLSIFTGTVTANVLFSPTKALFATDISLDTNEIFLDADEDSGIVSISDDVVQIFTNNIIRFAQQDTLLTVGTNIAPNADGTLTIGSPITRFLSMHAAQFGIDTTNRILMAVGVGLSFDASLSHTFDVGGTQKFQITSTLVQIVGDAEITANLAMGGEIDMNTNFIQFDAALVPPDPPATELRLFSDSTNSDHLSIRRVAETVDLEAGGSLTPWVSNIDGDGFFLQDVGGVEFRDNVTLPGSGIDFIAKELINLIYNTGGTDGHIFRIAGSQVFGLGVNINNSFNELDMNSNKITDMLDPTVSQDAATKAYVDSNTTFDGVQDAEIWLDHETAQYNFEVYHCNCKSGSTLSNTYTIIQDAPAYVPIFLGGRARLVNIAVDFSTGGTGTYSLTYGIYSRRTFQNYPETLIASNTGIFTGTGVKSMIFAEDLEAGMYFLAVLVTSADSPVAKAASASEAVVLGFQDQDSPDEMNALYGYVTTASSLAGTAPDDLLGLSGATISTPPVVFARFEFNPS